MLNATKLTKQYPTRSTPLTVIEDATLTLAEGQSASIMGPSGSGKSTLLNLLGALDAPSGGTLTINEQNPYALNPNKLANFRNQTIGFVFQDHHLLPQCNALENVLIPTLAAAYDATATDRARSLLERVGLAERADHLPAELSGGERQRVAIARALINQPRVLLADEPTGNLDQSTADRVAELLAELQAESAFILIVVTHARELAARFENRYLLDHGRLAPMPVEA